MLTFKSIFTTKVKPDRDKTKRTKEKIKRMISQVTMILIFK